MSNASDTPLCVIFPLYILTPPLNILSLSPDIIATGCPFCNTMITDGVKNINEGSAVVKDLAELISENI